MKKWQCHLFFLCVGRKDIKMFLAKVIFFFFFFFFAFQGHTRSIWKFPDQGSNPSYSCWPTPQPQQCVIQAKFATYNTAPRNAGSLTHRERPGIKPASSWILARFVSTAPQRVLPQPKFLFNLLLHIRCLLPLILSI